MSNDAELIDPDDFGCRQYYMLDRQSGLVCALAAPFRLSDLTIELLGTRVLLGKHRA